MTMKVLFAQRRVRSFFFKTGGLGDVAGALPIELTQQGVLMFKLFYLSIQLQSSKIQKIAEDVLQLK